MSPDNYGSLKRTPGCAATLSRCILFALIIIVAAVLVWAFWPHRHNVRSAAQIARTQATIGSLSRALEEYRAKDNTFPPDGGVGLHPDLDKPAECLVYYLSGATIFFDEAASPIDYPWNHDLYTDAPGKGGEGRRNSPRYYDFRAKSLKDADKDGIPEVVDSWGNPLLYNAGAKQDGPFNQNGAPKQNPTTYDLSSAGPDGKHGTEDDITSWRD